jgi:hypothetical protein
MSSLYQEKVIKIINSFSPKPLIDSYYPAGSLSSNQVSQETEENLSNKSFKKEGSDEEQYMNSIEMITYETFSPVSSNCSKDFKGLSRVLRDQKNLELSNKIEEMTQIINNLQERCQTYEKQNEDLRTEIKKTSKQLIETNKLPLKTENQKLQSKLNFHQTMLIKILSLAEDLCEEEPMLSQKMPQLDIHTYNYLISKLEIVRNRMNRQTTKIQQLEFEKSSISEMLHCYITTDKIIETKIRFSSTENTTSDCMYSGFSRKSSVLMETNPNSFTNKHHDNDLRAKEIYSKGDLSLEKHDEDYYKRPSSSASEAIENQDPLIPRSTFSNLKGPGSINKAGFQKPKGGNSFSVSPLIPKPKKSTQKAIGCKHSTKSNTLKVTKTQTEDKKKPVYKV